ncbi:MAG: glycosyltransferase [Chloroflexota bacterium]
MSSKQPPAVDLSIILPTFNEKDNIGDLINEIHHELAIFDIRYEILVMDDSSPDGTADTLREQYDLSTQDGLGECSPIGEQSLLRLHVRTTDKGLAQSIRDGLERSCGETLIVMDTDFNHSPTMIPQMVDLLRYYDLIIGSRYIMGGGMEESWRYRASLLYNIFIRVLFFTRIQDHLSGFFAIRRSRLFELDLVFDRIFYGYGDYFIRLLMLAWRNHWSILEVPVFYVLRRHGESKTGLWRVFRDYTSAVLKLRIFGL